MNKLTRTRRLFNTAYAPFSAKLALILEEVFTFFISFKFQLRNLVWNKAWSKLVIYNAGFLKTPL